MNKTLVFLVIFMIVSSLQCGEKQEHVKVIRTTKGSAEYEHVEIYSDMARSKIVTECLNIKNVANNKVEQCDFCAVHRSTYFAYLTKDEESGVEGWAAGSKIEIYMDDHLYYTFEFDNKIGYTYQQHFMIVDDDDPLYVPERLDLPFEIPVHNDQIRKLQDTQSRATSGDVWNGYTRETYWYSDSAKEFTIMTGAQLAGFADLVDAGITFEGKTVKLGADINLNYKLFNPIGSYRHDLEFKGIFDGQYHTIYNLSQNTWELDNGYYYSDLGLGLFGNVRDAIIRNLSIDGANISGESALCGTVVSVAHNCVFENINIRNTNINDYQYYAGGIVGWASGNHQYVNINIERSTTIGGQWGDFGNANGGIIGGISQSSEIHMKDCNVACRIDAVNDVVSSYDWYHYRRCGMIVGDTGYPSYLPNGVSADASAPQLTCDNVVVTYGAWANYHYCKFARGSYPFVRNESGISVSAYSNVRYGHPTDANGNEVVDDNHVHNEGEMHQQLIQFDQLYNGGGNGGKGGSRGARTHPGVTIIYNNK